MYIPDPFAFAAVKTAAYSAAGFALRPRAQVRMNAFLQAFAFGIMRALFGWLVGLPILLAVIAIGNDVSRWALVASLALPRIALSGALIHVAFRPRGGRPETFACAIALMLFASAIDLLLLAKYAQIDWLRISWC